MTREEALKKIEELKQFIEQDELKVGDYVEIITDDCESQNAKKGDQGRVVDVRWYCSYPIEVAFDFGEEPFEVKYLKKITREEYETEKALLADGWIRHTGDECPVDGDVAVEVKFNKGGCGEFYRATEWYWRKDNSSTEITHYRIVKEETKGLWKPKEDGEKYFTIFSDASISFLLWRDSNADNYKYLQGLIFRTKEEAETYKEKVLDVEGALRMIAIEDPVEWGDDECKYSFYYDYIDNEFFEEEAIYFKDQGAIYLTEQGKDRALEEIGEEALIYMIKNKR